MTPNRIFLDRRRNPKDSEFGSFSRQKHRSVEAPLRKDWRNDSKKLLEVNQKASYKTQIPLKFTTTE